MAPGVRASSPPVARGPTTWAVWALILLVLQSACVTGGGGPRGRLASAVVTRTANSDFTPIPLSEAEFLESFARLILEVPLSLTRPVPFSPGVRWVHVDWRVGGGRADSPEEGYAHLCEQRGTPGDCFLLLEAGQRGARLGHRGRFTLGLTLALAPAVDAAAGVLRDFSASAMTALLSGLSLYLVVLMAPEPISKGLALAMTLLLWSYLGHELWDLLTATRRLWNETGQSQTFHELREADSRYGQVLGPNTLRVLLLLATWKAGAHGEQTLTGTTALPRFTQATQNAVTAGRIHLSTAALEAESVAVRSTGLLLALPSGSGALLMSKEGGDVEGELHHIATVENEKSTLRGGPWTQRFKPLFDKAGMSMEDPANKIRIPGHKGPHPKEYHEHIYRRLRDALDECETTTQCRDALTRELKHLGAQLVKTGSELHKWITGTP